VWKAESMQAFTMGCSALVSVGLTMAYEGNPVLVVFDDETR